MHFWERDDAPRHENIANMASYLLINPLNALEYWVSRNEPKRNSNNVWCGIRYRVSGVFRKVSTEGEEVSGSLDALAALPLQMEQATNGIGGRASEPVWMILRREKSLMSAGNRTPFPRSFNEYTSGYTDWAIPAQCPFGNKIFLILRIPKMQ